MSERRERAVAVVGLGAILPDALSAPAFWNNVIGRRYSIAEVPAGRWAKLDEVVQAAIFFLDGPGYITGEILHLDGGRHLV